MPAARHELMNDRLESFCYWNVSVCSPLDFKAPPLVCGSFSKTRVHVEIFNSLSDSDLEVKQICSEHNRSTLVIEAKFFCVSLIRPWALETLCREAYLHNGTTCALIRTMAHDIRIVGHYSLDFVPIRTICASTRHSDRQCCGSVDSSGKVCVRAINGYMV